MRWYRNLLDRVAEWPAPWWLLGMLSLTFVPLVAVVIGLGALMGTGGTC